MMVFTVSCTDIPGFKDKYSTTCTQTREFGNCKDRKAAKYDEIELRENANTEGLSVLDACCVCGGGNKGSKNQETWKMLE